MKQNRIKLFEEFINEFNQMGENPQKIWDRYTKENKLNDIENALKDDCIHPEIIPFVNIIKDEKIDIKYNDLSDEEQEAVDHILFAEPGDANEIE